MKLLQWLTSRLSALGTALPSVRLAIYFAAGTVLWVGATVEPGFVIGALVYDALLLFVALVDVTLSPQPHEFEVERELQEKMNLGTPNVVKLYVRNNGNHARRLSVRDEA